MKDFPAIYIRQKNTLDFSNGRTHSHRLSVFLQTFQLDHTLPSTGRMTSNIFEEGGRGALDSSQKNPKTFFVSHSIAEKCFLFQAKRKKQQQPWLPCYCKHDTGLVSWFLPNGVSCSKFPAFDFTQLRVGKSLPLKTGLIPITIEIKSSLHSFEKQQSMSSNLVIAYLFSPFFLSFQKQLSCASNFAQASVFLPCFLIVSQTCILLDFLSLPSTGCRSASVLNVHLILPYSQQAEFTCNAS